MGFSGYPFVDQIKDRTPTANGFDGRCPAHDDQQASLSVGLGDDGRLLLHCHKGCSTAEVLRALGITSFAATMPKRGKKRKKKAGKFVAAYDYADENGHRLYQVLRFVDEKTGRKTFRQRRPAKDSTKWVYSLQFVRRVLYRLPQILAADPAQPVYIAEGEKDVHTLGKGGFIATCNSGGAEGWTDELAPHLKGRDVVLIEDNDAAGRKWVNTVGKSLTGIARSIRVIRFPNEKQGFDVTDWSDSHEPGELAKLTVFAPHFEPTEEPDDTRSVDKFELFPTDVLPEPVARFVHEAARSIGCDESYVVLPLLSALASAVGNTRRIRLKSSWTEPCIIWTVIVAPSGSKKSPALSLSVKALQKRQDQAFREHEGAVSDYQEAKAIYDVQLADWKKRGVKHNETMPVMPERPVAVRYITSDSTAEAMAALLSESPRGLLLCRDELSAWLSSFDSYKASRGVDAPFWLELHRAGSVTVDRKTSKRVTHIPRASCSITGTIQPAVLNSCIGGRSEDEDDDREFLSNGLIARFLPASPPQRPSRWTDFEISAAAESGIERIIDWLLTLDFVPPDDPDDLGDPESIDLSLSVDGRAAWVAFYNQHSREAAELQHDAAAAWAKLEGYVARFALLIHLLRCATNDSTLADRDLIDAHSMSVGIKITRWFGAEISRLLAEVGGKGDSPYRREQRRLINLIQEHGGRITVRALLRCSRRFGKTAEEVEKRLNGLVKLKRGQWETTQTAGRQKREFVLSEGVDVDGSPGNCGETDLPSTSTPDSETKTTSDEHGDSVPDNSETISQEAESWSL